MIHWAWLIPTFIVGGMFGVVIMCVFYVAKEG